MRTTQLKLNHPKVVNYFPNLTARALEDVRRFAARRPSLHWSWTSCLAEELCCWATALRLIALSLFPFLQLSYSFNLLTAALSLITCLGAAASSRDSFSVPHTLPSSSCLLKRPFIILSVALSLIPCLRAAASSRDSFIMRLSMSVPTPQYGKWAGISEGIDTLLPARGGAFDCF